MAEQRTSLHGHWSSRLAFILAVTGSAVGLGNIWKFPYMAGQNGGGAFVLVYLICVFMIGLPIMMAEILIGRRGRRNPVATMRLVGEEETGTSHWRWVGILGVATGILILSYYSVIAGWAVAYIFEAGSGAFTGAGTEAIGDVFTSVTADPLRAGFWHTLFMSMTVFVVAFGVEAGLERAVRLLMPALLVLLLGLLGYVIVEADFRQGLEFMFAPRMEDLTGPAVLAALGHAFFTLSVGMGAIMAYGAYLPGDESIGRTSIAVVLADTAIAILAGLVIFPIVFSYGVDEASGPGLVFQSLPLAFGQMEAGIPIAVSFFILLTFAAWTSAISLMEPAVTFFIEQLGFQRWTATLSVGGVIWLFGLLSVMSFGPWAAFQHLRGTFFDNFEYLTSNILLPLGGFAIVVFAGWFMAQNSTADEIDPAAGPMYHIWLILARYIAPIAIILVMLNVLGVLPALFDRLSG